MQMDPSNLATITAPFLVKGAEAFTHAASDNLATEVGNLCQAVIDKFGSDSDAKNTLVIAQNRPDSGPMQSALKEILAEKFKSDPDFASNVQVLIQKLFDQQGQTVHGPQTNTGNGNGPVFSGRFDGPMASGGGAVDMRGCKDLTCEPHMEQHFGDKYIINNPSFTGHDKIGERKYMDQMTSIRDFDINALKRFRNQLRDDIRELYPDSLSPIEFLTSTNLLFNGYLTRTGALLFGNNPIDACRSAITQCYKYYGINKTAARERRQINRTIPDQIVEGRNFIANNIKKVENPVPDQAESRIEYEYPMICVREIIANALAHRDYEGDHRFVHITLFSDRIEVKSPGNWFGKPLDNEKIYKLEDLESSSIKRNIALSDVLSWILLVEGEGSGIPTAVEDCKKMDAPIPNVVQIEEYVTVTIWPSRKIQKFLREGIIPHQIPPPPAEFKGREGEIQHVMANFANGAIITGLRGMGGVGKTALALVLAERLEDSFPDGQIFLDMQGTSSKPLQGTEAMAQVIRAYLGADFRIPEDLNGIRGLYNSVLSSKRALILLDNVANREQVEPLLPPTGSALLITTRNRFALAGLMENDLDVLPLSDAKRLLLEISERIGEHAGELAKLCGCLPLALRNAAYVLAEKKNMSVVDYLERLKDAKKRLGLVEASFSLSYELLCPELQRLWCLLSVFPGDWDLAGAAAVWDLDQDSAEESLAELMKLSLIDFLQSALGGRYRLHDLARIYADSRLNPQARIDGQLRHAEFYKDLLSRANSLYKVGGPGIHSGLALFDREWPNIRAGQSLAEDRMNDAAIMSEESKKAFRLCNEYPYVGAYILDWRLHPLDIIRWRDTALTASRHLKDRASEGKHLLNLGNANADLGEHRKAIEYYVQAMKISREIGDMRSEGAVLINLGNANADLGEPRNSIECYEQALKIICEIGDHMGEATVLGNLGNVYADLSEHHKAIEYYERAMKIVREIGDKRGEGAILGNLGFAHLSLGVPRKAIEFYKQALKISREIGDRRDEGNCLGNLGLAYFRLDQAVEAIEYYDQALKISREIGDRRSEGIRLLNMSYALDRLGKPAKATKLAELALKIYKEIDSLHVVQVHKLLDGWQK